MNAAIGLPNAHSIQYYPFAQAKVSHLVGSAECQTHGNRRGRMGSVRCVGRPNFIVEGRAQNNNALKKIGTLFFHSLGMQFNHSCYLPFPPIRSFELPNLTIQN